MGDGGGVGTGVGDGGTGMGVGVRGGGTMSVAVGVGVASTVGMADGVVVGTAAVAGDVAAGEGEGEISGVGSVGRQATTASAAHNAAKMRAALQDLAGPAFFNITWPIRRFNPPHPSAPRT